MTKRAKTTKRKKEKKTTVETARVVRETPLCPNCRSDAATDPTGQVAQLAGAGFREWRCAPCGTVFRVHDATVLVTGDPTTTRVLDLPGLLSVETRRRADDEQARRLAVESGLGRPLSQDAATHASRALEADDPSHWGGGC